MLEVKGLVAGYDGQDVLHDVSLSVAPGTVTSVVGANGAGKSTLLRAISGVVAPSGGELWLDGERLRRRSAAALVAAGVVHVPEGRQVFAGMSVEQNLMLGAYTVRSRTTIRKRLAEVLEIFPDLGSRLSQFAGALSGGQQQMLAIGRGLMVGPRYLLLDEPSLGLAPLITEKIFEVIGELRTTQVGVLLVEQNGRLALSVADHGLLLEQGRVTMSGTGEELLADNNVIERYLGVGVKIGGDPGERAALVARLQGALAE